MRFISSMLGLWLGQVLGDAFFFLLGKPFDAAAVRDRLAILAVAMLAARLVAALTDDGEKADGREGPDRFTGKTPNQGV